MTNGTTNSAEEEFRKFNEAQRKELFGDTGAPQGTETPGETNSRQNTQPQENGDKDNSGNDKTPDAGQTPPSQPDTPTEEYTNAFDFESHAYNLGNLAEKQKELPAKAKSGSGAKPPERKKDGYKPGSSSNFLQACYNEIIVAAYAGAIDFAVDLTLDILDWVLYAPFGGGKSAEKKKEKKEKTIFDYADEMIAENNEKAKELIKSFALHHKEIIDNVELAQNGQKPVWRVWKGKKTECFDYLVGIKTKADADPNSPEATLWKEFKENLPHKAIEHIARLTDTANFAVHHAALSVDIKSIEPMHPEFIKAFNEMEKIIENPKLSDTDLKKGLSENINNARQHILVCAEINEKLDKFAKQLKSSDCTIANLTEKFNALSAIKPVPENVTKTLKEINNIIENPKFDVKDSQTNDILIEKINNISKCVTISPSISADITENLNKFSELLLIPNCSRKAMAESIISLKEINPIKHNLKQDASIVSKEITKNLELIDRAYAKDPSKAAEEKNKYLERINQSQVDAAAKHHKNLHTVWFLRKFGIKNLGNTQKNAQKATQYAADTINDPGVPKNNSGPDQQPKKIIQNDADIRKFINFMGMKR